MEEFKNTKEPLKVANIEQNLIEEDLEESAKVSVILSILTRKLEDSKVNIYIIFGFHELYCIELAC